MAKAKLELPGGVLACGRYHAQLRPDEWTALQWMRFRFSRADSAADSLLREQPIPPARADELTEFVLRVHAQSGEPLFPLHYGRGAHLQRDVQALVGRSPKRRGGPAMLRDLLPLQEAVAALGGLARQAVREDAPVVATSAMTLLRLAWDARWREEETGDDDDRGAHDPRADADVLRRLERMRPEIGEDVWRIALARCTELSGDASELAERHPAGDDRGRQPVDALARRRPGFPDEVYRHALSIAYLESR